MPRSRELPSPLGPLRLHADAGGVYALVFVEAVLTTRNAAGHEPGTSVASGGGASPPEPAGREAGGRAADAALTQVAEALQRYFAGTPLPPDLPLSPRGTAFQHRVWAAVAAIPPGTTRTYTELARELRSGARAVGAANAANPLPLLVPCHRLVGADGALCGYRGGLWAKRWLLDHEAGRTPP